MNIALFTDSYSPQVNGVVTVVRTLKTELEKRGHRAFVFTVKHPDAVKEKEEGVFRFKSFRFPYEPQHRVGYFFQPQIVRLVQKLNLDVLHTHSEFSLMLAAHTVRRKLKIPAIHTLHTYYPDYIQYMPWPISRYLRKHVDTYLNFMLRSHTCVITPSEKNKALLEAIQYRKPVKIIPNGIRLADFYCTEGSFNREVEEFKAKYALEKRGRFIIFMGRLGVEKNLYTLLDNFLEIRRRKKDVHLILAGDGPERAALERYAEELGIRRAVTFTGYLRWPGEVKAAYKASDLFMSASRSEVHPVSFIEAMASGLPVIAAADTSISSMVYSGVNGFTEDNASILWEKALPLLDNADTLQQMGKKSEELSRRFSVENFVDSMLAVYHEYASSTPKPNTLRFRR